MSFAYRSNVVARSEWPMIVRRAFGLRELPCTIAAIMSEANVCRASCRPVTSSFAGVHAL